MKLPLWRVAEFTEASGNFDGEQITQGYSIDSRTIQPGDLFFAVKGERLDGHDFVSAALKSGATAAVVQQEQAEVPDARFVARTSQISEPLTCFGRDLVRVGRCPLLHEESGVVTIWWATPPWK